MPKTIAILFALLLIGLLAQPTRAERFRGRTLHIDTYIGASLSPTNENQTTLPTLLKGETFQLEFFIDSVRSARTKKFVLAFDNTGNHFGDYFRIVKLEGIVSQDGLPGPTSVTARSDQASTISTNDYLATVTLAAKQNLSPGLQLRMDSVRTYVIDDADGAADTLHVADAVVTFGQPSYALSLDLNTSPGDQKLVQSYGNAPTGDIAMQIFGENVKFMTGFILRFEYDTSQISFNAFETGDLLPGVQTLDPIVTQLDSPYADVEVTAASFGGSAPAENGWFGTLTFKAQEGFTHTNIRLTSAEIRRGGEFLPFFTPLSVNLSSLNADFNNDGFIDFHDFLLFAEHFGTKRGDQAFDARYDLVPDGAVTFADFLLFTESLSFYTVTVIK